MNNDDHGTSNNSLLGARLRRHVDVLAGLIGPRHMLRPSTMEASLAHIRREFESHGQSAQVERYEVSDDTTADNLFIEQRGTRSPDEVVILGAHYDTVTSTPGADDNASAVAMMLETARLLSGCPLARTVRFVAFANEEPPHFYQSTMGSQVHARQCRLRGEKVVGMICLEMVGFFSDAPGSQRYPAQIRGPLLWPLPKQGDFLGMVSNLRSIPLLMRARRGFRRASKLPIVALPLPESINEIRLSDHAQFWDQNYPALMVTDTSFFRNPHYHQPTDTPETLDYERMAAATQGVAGAVAAVAGK